MSGRFWWPQVDAACSKSPCDKSTQLNSEGEILKETLCQTSMVQNWTEMDAIDSYSRLLNMMTGVEMFEPNTEPKLEPLPDNDDVTEITQEVNLIELSSTTEGDAVKDKDRDAPELLTNTTQQAEGVEDLFEPAVIVESETVGELNVDSMTPTPPDVTLEELDVTAQTTNPLSDTTSDVESSATNLNPPTLVLLYRRGEHAHKAVSSGRGSQTQLCPNYQETLCIQEK